MNIEKEKLGYSILQKSSNEGKNKMEYYIRSAHYEDAKALGYIH